MKGIQVNGFLSDIAKTVPFMKVGASLRFDSSRTGNLYGPTVQRGDWPCTSSVDVDEERKVGNRKEK
jgi:hypothetical protein